MKTLGTLFTVISVASGIKATPPLPARRVTASDYQDIAYSFVEKYNDPDVYDRYCYKIHVINTGEGYLNNVTLTFDDGYRTYDSQIVNAISSCSVIGPYQEADFVIPSYYNVESSDGFTVQATAFKDFTNEIEISGNKEIYSSRYEDGHYYNTVDIYFGNGRKDQYCYGAIIKAKVAEEDAFFVVNAWDNYAFDTTTPVDDYAEVIGLIKTPYSAYEEEWTYDHISYDYGSHHTEIPIGDCGPRVTRDNKPTTIFFWTLGVVGTLCLLGIIAMVVVYIVRRKKKL